MIQSIDMKSLQGVYQYHSFTQEQIIQDRVKESGDFIKNLISSQGVYNYQSFKQEQTIKSMNLKS